LQPNYFFLQLCYPSFMWPRSMAPVVTCLPPLPRLGHTHSPRHVSLTHGSYARFLSVLTLSKQPLLLFVVGGSSVQRLHAQQTRRLFNLSPSGYTFCGGSLLSTCIGFLLNRSTQAVTLAIAGYSRANYSQPSRMLTARSHSS
jgi:hypothetical protein